MARSTCNRLVIANIVSDVLVDGLPADVVQKLNAVAHRELWSAGPGDLVVCPGPVSPEFRRYAADTLGTAPAAVIGAVFDADLPAVARELAAANPAAAVAPYALSRSVVAAATAASLPVLGYAAPPPATLVDQLYEWNTKSGFRHLADRLELEVVPGRACAGVEQAAAAAEALTADSGEALLKFDRSASGYGHLRTAGGAGAADRVRLHASKFPLLRPAFVVEQFVHFRSTPSVELEVTDAAVRVVYLSDMICYGQRFSGLITPPPDLSAATAEQMGYAGRRVGAVLHQAGYRGTFDLDAGVADDGRLLFHEINVRRTGGTYLNELVSRLPGRVRGRKWRSDTRPATTTAEFGQGVDALRSAGLVYRPDRGEGAVLTADTLAVDHQWRYLVVARDHATAARLEERVLEHLAGC